MLPSFISTFWSYVCFLHLFLFMAGPPSKLWAITSVAFITHARTCTDRYGWTRTEGAWESAAHARVRPFASFAWLQANSLSGLLVLFFFCYLRPAHHPTIEVKSCFVRQFHFLFSTAYVHKHVNPCMQVRMSTHARVWWGMFSKKSDIHTNRGTLSTNSGFSPGLPRLQTSWERKPSWNISCNQS